MGQDVWGRVGQVDATPGQLGQLCRGREGLLCEGPGGRGVLEALATRLAAQKNGGELCEHVLGESSELGSAAQLPCRSHVYAVLAPPRVHPSTVRQPPTFFIAACGSSQISNGLPSRPHHPWRRGSSHPGSRPLQKHRSSPPQQRIQPEQTANRPGIRCCPRKCCDSIHLPDPLSSPLSVPLSHSSGGCNPLAAQRVLRQGKPPQNKTSGQCLSDVLPGILLRSVRLCHQPTPKNGHCHRCNRKPSSQRTTGPVEILLRQRKSCSAQTKS